MSYFYDDEAAVFDVLFFSYEIVDIKGLLALVTCNAVIMEGVPGFAGNAQPVIDGLVGAMDISTPG
jgi:hypothetical protein